MVKLFSKDELYDLELKMCRKLLLSKLHSIGFMDTEAKIQGKQNYKHIKVVGCMFIGV